MPRGQVRCRLVETIAMGEYQLGVIGGGNMAEALLRGVIGGNFMPHGAIVVSEPVAKRRQLLTHDLGVATVDDNVAAAGCPRVLLAVKPQVMGKVLDGIASAVGEGATVISIAAGIPTSLIDAKLSGRGRIVRVMPNAPMLVGEGISAVAAGPG